MSTPAENDNRAIPKPIYIRNFACPNVAHFDPKNMEAAMDYRAEDGDIIICAYPKTGTTWMQYIIWQILHENEPYPTLNDLEIKYFPFMELTGIEAVEILTSPRCYKTHFSYNILNINKNAKYIYIHRNPMDTLVSFYHFTINTQQRPIALDDYFERFMKGEVSYGDYFDHVLSFNLHKDEPHLHIFSYEDLHKDKKEQVLRIAKILGDEYYKALIENDARMQKLLDVTSFNYMKKNLNTNMLLKGDNADQMITLDMFRKGVVGDGRNVLSSEQIDRLRQKMLAKMKGTDYVQYWS